MPKKEKDQMLNMKNMPFTDQRDFLRALASIIYTNDELELSFTRRDVTVTKQNVIDAIKKSLVMGRQKDRIANDFTLDNLKEISKNHIANVKDLIKKGKMVDNIQTEHNEIDTVEFNEYNLSPLEGILKDKLSNLSEKDKTNFLNFKLSDKDIINNFSKTFDDGSILDYFNKLSSDIFKTVSINPSGHDYGNNLNNRNKRPTLEELEIQEKGFKTNKEVKKDDVIRYAQEIKAFNDMLNKKPWYIRWFSSSYSRQKEALNVAKEVLYSRGITEDSLNKFIKSNGDEINQDKLFDLNKESINEYNLNSKKALDNLLKKQEDINFINAQEEIKYAAKAKETLDKVVDAQVDPGLTDEYFEEQKESIKKEKEFFEANINSGNLGLRQKMEVKNRINELNEDISRIDKAKEDVRNKNVVYNEMDDLEFDASKDIVDSSDNLQERLGMEFDDDLEIEGTLEAFKDDSEITNEMEM